MVQNTLSAALAATVIWACASAPVRVRSYLADSVTVSPATADSLAADGVWRSDSVEEGPVFLSMPQVAYPDIPRTRTDGGRIILQGILNQNGSIEPGSIRVIAAFEPRLAGFAAEAFLHARFKAARVHGKPVRVLVNVPFDFFPKSRRDH